MEKALRILALFTEVRPEWNATSAARELGLPVTTAHRLIRALHANGLLVQIGDTRYRLGLAAVTLGRRAISSYEIRASMRPGLEALVAQTGETAVLEVYDGHLHALCVDRVEAVHPLRLSLEVGSTLPLHAGATAKPLLAFLGDGVLDAVLAEPLEPRGPHTITDPVQLRAEVARIRRRGWALSREETDAGAWGVAAPVLDDQGRPAASIGIAAPTVRYSTTAAGQAAQAVRAVAGAEIVHAFPREAAARGS